MHKAPHTLPFSIFVALALFLTAASEAHAEQDRSGFTLELSSRVGSFFSFQIDGDNVLEPVVAPISVSVGGFVNHRLAIFGSASAAFFQYSPPTSLSADSRLQTSTTRSLFLGVTAQVWLGDSWALGGGLGLSTISHGPVEAEVNRGFAIPARASWFFAQTSKGSLGATLEVAPTFFSRGETTLSSTIGVQWQWL